MEKKKKEMKYYRVSLVRGNQNFIGTVKAYSPKQAAAYWSRKYLGDPQLRHYVDAIEIDEYFTEKTICPVCGIKDPLVALGQIVCPNCG